MTDRTRTDDRDPERQGARAALCTLGNGHVCARDRNRVRGPDLQILADRRRVEIAAQPTASRPVPVGHDGHFQQPARRLHPVRLDRTRGTRERPVREEPTTARSSGGNR